MSDVEGCFACCSKVLPDRFCCSDCYSMLHDNIDMNYLTHNCLNCKRPIPDFEFLCLDCDNKLCDDEDFIKEHDEEINEDKEVDDYFKSLQDGAMDFRELQDYILDMSSLENQISDIIEAEINEQASENVKLNEQASVKCKPLPDECFKCHVIISSDLLEETRECVICMDCFKIGEKGIKLPCDHIYHENCILQWSQDTCPKCRLLIS